MLGIGRLYDLRKFSFVSATVGGTSVQDYDILERCTNNFLYPYYASYVNRMLYNEFRHPAISNQNILDNIWMHHDPVENTWQMVYNLFEGRHQEALEQIEKPKATWELLEWDDYA